MPQLNDKVKALDAEIDSTRDAAQSKWAAFDALRTDLAGSDVDLTNEDSEEFKKAHEAHREYGDLAEKLDSLTERRKELWAMTSESNGNGGPVALQGMREQIKDGLHSHESFGARIVASEQYAALKQSGDINSTSRLGNVRLGEMMDRGEFHSVIVGAPGGANTAAPFVTPLDRGFVEPRDRPLLLTDLIMVGQTDSDSLEYVVETGFTNNAGFIPEATTDAAIGSGTPAVTAAAAGVKPQSALTYEKRSQTIRTLAHWVAITRRALADVPRMQSLVDGRLRYGLARVLDQQIVNGDGAGENLTGILNTTGVQAQAKGTDTLVDATHKAITKVRLAFFEPNAVAYHPNDWEGIRLAKDTNGQYYYGPPALAGPQTVWGLPTVTGAQFPAGNPLVGDFRTAELYLREGVQVLASDSHADFFVRNLIALLAEMRVGFIVPQPEAFCEVTA